MTTRSSITANPMMSAAQPSLSRGAVGGTARTNETGSHSLGFATAHNRYNDPRVLARLAALKTTGIVDLKAEWRDLFQTEPPPFNRKYLESRLAYRIQELAFGGLKPETLQRLAALGEELERGAGSRVTREKERRPITGTRLIREWQGVEHTVTVTASGYEWDGRPYKSLSAVARAITGTRWNGWTFFGLQASGRAG
jgi:hypothetical protein